MHEVVGRAILATLVVVAIGATPLRSMAQEPNTSCDRLVSESDQQLTAEGITYLWSNFRAGCGDARMSADSAVVRESGGVLLLGRLIRGVRYQDSTRSLTSDSLIYSGTDDRVVAMGHVVLTTREGGIELTGPRVEFYRLTRSGAEQTIATQRPRVTLRGEPDSGKPATTIDSDRLEIFREDNAWYWGDVEIRRPDAVSLADSAYFDMVAETGMLYGNARVEGEEFELRGDSIRLVLTDDVLRSVHAFQGAEATGEDFEIASEQIAVSFVDGDVDQVEAFGRRSAAISGGYHLLGDSLHFKLRDGAIDSTFAIGSAVAIEDTAADLGREPSLGTEGDEGWLAGDTIVASFRRLEPPDSAESPEVAGSELEELRTSGNARAFYVAADTTDDGPPARNYLIGQRISIFFEAEEATRVVAERAIGVYLDPDPNARPPASTPVPGEEGEPAPGARAGEAPGVRAGEAAEDSVESQPEESEQKDLGDRPRARQPGNSP